MIETYLGEIIRKNRVAQRLSQEKLCEGICDPGTLSRIENGTRVPTRERAVALLQRLGLSADRYYMLLNKYDAEIDSLQTALVRYNIQYERAQAENKPAIKLQAQEQLRKLEETVKKDDLYTQQFILRTKALLGRSTGGDYSPEERLELLMDAIHLTLPSFRLEKISEFRYSFEEIKIIVQIATTYRKADQLKESVSILAALYDYVMEHNQHMLESAGKIPLVSYNYALELGQIERFDDAIKIAETGYQACVNHGTYQLLPGFIHILAECYHFVGEDAKSADFYKRAYYLYELLGNGRDLQILVDEAKKYVGLTF